MKIFISWSGEVSRNAAMALRDWLPSVIKAVKPFVSPEDIDRGSKWFPDISTKLEQTDFGILCITPQNATAPWIIFEAGALSKKLDLSKVTPFLVGLSPSDLEGPLAQFYATSTEQENVFKLVKTINNQLEKNSLPETALKRTFDRWWPDLDKHLQRFTEDAQNVPQTESTSKRKMDDMVVEILNLSRSIARQLSLSQNSEIPLSQQSLAKQLLTDLERSISEKVLADHQRRAHEQYLEDASS